MSMMKSKHKRSLLAAAVVGTCAVSGVQAATLVCGSRTPLRVSTAPTSSWSTDARLYVASTPSTPGGPATIRDDYKWTGWFNPASSNQPATPSTPVAGQSLQGKWLSFGDAQYTYPAGGGNVGGNTGSDTYPPVITNGNTATGSWFNGRVTFIYNEPITIPNNVNLASIKVQGAGGADDAAWFVVKPATPPSGATNWLRQTALGMNWAAPGSINLDGNTTGLGFYYGDNTIAFAVQNAGNSPTTSAGNPTGLMADIVITADCQDSPPAQPTAPLMCPAGNKAGDPVRIGPFTTNARDWKWTQRSSAPGVSPSSLVSNTSPAQPSPCLIPSAGAVTLLLPR